MPSHIPLPLKQGEIDHMAMAVRSSSLDLSQTVALYNRVYDLPRLSLVAGRLRLSGIVFPLDDFVSPSESDPDSDLFIYHATSPMPGDVTIQMADNLSNKRDLVVIHPWICLLLDQDFLQGIARSDLGTRALGLIVRLRQPFGGLLLAPSAREQYRRVATDSLIMVQVREETPLSELMDGIHTVVD